MLNSNNANLLKDKDAIRSNMILLLSSERDTLFGDPFYGSQTRKYIFQQVGSIVPDLLIDELYTTIATFMPQVNISRKDISVYIVDKTLYADIKYYYVIDNTSDLFTIKLTQVDNEG
jgi:phage baseplate assembly protein W